MNELLIKALKLCGELINKCTETITEYEKQMAQKDDELAKFDKDYKQLAEILKIERTEKLELKKLIEEKRK